MEYKLRQLNLPIMKPTLREVDGKVKIWDCLRKRFIMLTPEEWVRQNFVSFLVNYKSYNPTLMANEVRITLNGMSRRCDTVLYSQSLVPKMIIEYKRPTVAIGASVFKQICRYNLVMKVDYLIVSNGLEHYCCKMDYEHETYQFLHGIPDYPEL